MSVLGELGSFILGSLYALRVPLAVGGVVALVALAVVARRRGWTGAARRHPRRTAGLVALALVLGGPLGWYLVSPVFIRTELQEPPVVAGAEPAPAPASPATPEPDPPATPAPSPAGESAPPALPSATPLASPTPWVAAAPRSGEFHGTDDFHYGRGSATLREAAPGEWVVRFEDFSVRNGPDLYVYLSPDPDGYVDGAIEVARLKATDGSFNTRVPKGTDLSGVRSVLIWCKQFSHLFAVAPLDG